MSQPGWREWGRSLVRSYWTPAGKQALRNFLGLGICTAISQACALGVLLSLTHSLSPTAFGAVIFALNLQTYLVTLGTFGLASVVVRDLAQQPDKADETISAFLTIVGIASCLTGLLTAVVVALVPISWDERAILWCVAAGNVAACLNLSPLFDAAHRQAVSAILLVPGDVLAVLTIYFLSTLGELTPATVGFVMLAKWGLTAASHLTVYHRVIRPIRGIWDRTRMQRMMAAGRPLLFAGLLYTIPMSGSVVLVRLLNGDEATAIYGLAFQVLAIEITVVGILIRVIQPHINGPHGLSRSFLRQLALVLGAVLTGMTVATLVLGWLLFQYALPDYYRSTYEVIAVLQAFVVCYTLAATVNVYLIRFHHERWIRVEHFIAVAGYLGILLLGSSKFQLGFAASTVVCSLLLLVVGLVGLWGTKPLPT